MTAHSVNMVSVETEAVPKRPLIQKVLVILGIMSVVSGTITGVMTAVNVGVTDTFLMDWFSSFIFALIILAPAGFLMMLVISKLVDSVFPGASKTQRNIVVGISMAIVMESLMAAITSTNTIGFDDTSLFLEAWFNGFIVALPVGIAMSLVMSLTLKPKLEKFMES